MKIHHTTLVGFLICLVTVWSSFLPLQAQVTLAGRVIDSTSREPLPYVNVVVPNSTLGTTTDNDGNFEIEVPEKPRHLSFSFLGYINKSINLVSRPLTGMRVMMVEENTTLQEVLVTARKGKYSRKENPAVDFIKKMLEQKEKNQMKQYAYYQYDKYEKVRLDVTNMTQKFIERPVFNSVDFIFDNLDTNALGKSYLPFYLEESLTTVYYQKEPQSQKEYREALKVTNLDNRTSGASIVKFTENLYEDVNIYANQIFLFDQPFMSPLADMAPTFYQFFIQDTISFKGQQAMRIAFAPANKYAMAFRGMLHVSLNGSYQVLEAHLTLLDQINLNFVNNLEITQEFTKIENNWVPTREVIGVDYEITQNLLGLSGYKTTYYENYSFNKPPNKPIHEQSQNVISNPDQEEKSKAYWKQSRPVPLSQNEQQVYTMMDTLIKVPQVKRAVTALKLFSSGFFTAGPVDVGDVFTFLSYNQVEGVRLKVGGKTNGEFNKRLQLKSYLAYGFKDQEWKYSAEAIINLRSGFSAFPKQYLSFKATRDYQFPGQFIQSAERDNFLLSFTTGAADKMIGFKSYSGTYFHELPGNLSYQISYNRRNQTAEGDFSFANGLPNNLNESQTIRTAEIGVSLTYAPHANYFEGQHVRYPIPNQYPILTLDYRSSYNGLLGSDYQFHKLSFGVEKRFYLSTFGTSNVDFRMGKVLGKRLPYVLLHMPPANQTLTYQENAFNTMRFLEFVSDQYALLIYSHDFNGFLINRVPFLRNFKLREAITFRSYYGSLSANNNPNINPLLIQFARQADGTPETYFITKEPFMEVSAGIYNIFKILRIDFVKRLNYLNQPYVPSLFGMKGAGIRLDVTLEF